MSHDLGFYPAPQIMNVQFFDRIYKSVNNPIYDRWLSIDDFQFFHNHWALYEIFMELICIFQLITLLGQPIWRRKHEKEEQEEKTKAGKENANRRETVKTTKQL